MMFVHTSYRQGQAHRCKAAVGLVRLIADVSRSCCFEKKTDALKQFAKASNHIDR